MTPMRKDDVFESKYLKASDLRDNDVTVTMDRVQKETVGDDHKPVLYFQGKKKGLVLNITNWNNIALLYGDESDDWTGQRITLFPTTTDFQGRTTECIRVKGPKGPPKHEVEKVAVG